MGKRPKNLKTYSIALPLAFANVMVEHGLSEITDKFVLLLSDRGVMTPVTRQPIDREWTRKYYNRHKAEILALVNKLKEEAEMAKAPTEETKTLTGIAKELADVKDLYPSTKELKGKTEGGRKKAWEKLEYYYKTLAEVCKKVRDKYFQDVNLEAMNFSTAALRAEFTDKTKAKRNPAKARYDTFKKEVKEPLEAVGKYDDVWAGIKLASMVRWLSGIDIAGKGNLSYRHMWTLVQIDDTNMRASIIKDFLSDWDKKKESQKSLASLQEIIDQHMDEQTLATIMPKVDADATLDYDTVMAKLRQGELSVLTNHSMLAVASKALSDGKSQELGKRLAEIRDTELNAITKSINKLMVILEVEE